MIPPARGISAVHSHGAEKPGKTKMCIKFLGSWPEMSGLQVITIGLGSRVIRIGSLHVLADVVEGD